MEYQLTRATIPLETVLGDARDKDGKWIYHLVSHPRIGYIRIFDNFGERTTDEFRAALMSYREPGRQIDGLILDLRYNRGGLLEAARDICDMLLDGGDIVTTRGRHGKLLKQFEAEPGVELPLDCPVVVLVDRLSASALRLTVGSYHRPSGKEIHKWKEAKESDDWGVRPDPGLDVLLTNRQNELVILARRKRDLLSWDALQRRENDLVRTSEKPPSSQTTSPAGSIPVPTADPEGQVAESTPSLDMEAAAAASRDPAAIDPQLQKALEYLEEQTEARSREPGRA
ncbi:MAG: hypothetical protein JF612_12330 [Planctomycetia bacterium]|nr:hypothetical protein [Planctomycetia bacterium]